MSWKSEVKVGAKMVVLGVVEKDAPDVVERQATSGSGGSL
jgi:hypothetical protein